MYQINTKKELEDFVCKEWNKLTFFLDEWQKGLPIPLTSSIDIRESLYKYAPVDHNMYPAGFNNICHLDLDQCTNHFKVFFTAKKIPLGTIGLLPESHTKNKFYLENLYYLKRTIENAGYPVQLISPNPDLFQEDKITLELETESGKKLEIHKVEFKENQFYQDKNPLNLSCIIINNDQSVPFDIDWNKLITPIFPSPYAGWFQRQKINHFKNYHRVCEDFCKEFDINPDLLEAKFSYVEKVDFESKEGVDRLGNEVESLLKNLPAESKVFVKASQGTYGMGILVANNKQDIIEMNRRERNKMNIGKNNIKFTSVLIQEGVETIVKFNDAPAEVTIYVIDGKLGGGFMRVNPLKGTNANLNSQGMLYQKLCLAEIKQNHDHKQKEAVYSIIARLSVIAAAYEINDLSRSST